MRQSTSPSPESGEGNEAFETFLRQMMGRIIILPIFEVG